MTNELYEKHCWALVDLDAMQSNLALIQKTVGAPVCCVVKADAYGHGALWPGPWLEENGAAAFAVSCLAEARHLRRHGISKPILILGYTDRCRWISWRSTALPRPSIPKSMPSAFRCRPKRRRGGTLPL